MILRHGVLSLAMLVAAAGCRSTDSADEAVSAEAGSELQHCGKHGGFQGTVKAEWLENGRKMRLLAPFAYWSPQGEFWNAPEGAVVDGASIPQLLWTFAGGPFTGAYRRASVVHDVACDERARSWQAVHRMFYDACRCAGVGRLRAKVMYAAVRRRGPRWEPGGALTGPPRSDRATRPSSRPCRSSSSAMTPASRRSSVSSTSTWKNACSRSAPSCRATSSPIRGNSSSR